MNDFPEFGKIARLNRTIVISEKIDGTNGLISIQPLIPDIPTSEGGLLAGERRYDTGGLGVGGANGMVYELRAGSRSRWITPEADNFGFARWVYAHADELVLGLGEGLHYGEWWGAGIQRKYGLNEKRFSLFDAGRWIAHDYESRAQLPEGEPLTKAPVCCHVVPVLYRGPFTTQAVEDAVVALRMFGSYAAPGFMNAEGVVVWHEAARVAFKKTLDKDEEPKGKGKR